MKENADVIMFTNPEMALRIMEVISEEEKSTIKLHLIVGECFPKDHVFAVETKRFEKFLKSYGTEYAKDIKEGGEENDGKSYDCF